MTTATEMTAQRDEIRAAVKQLCDRFPAVYWRELDQKREYPTEFVQAMTDAGWLAALIPEEYGGAGLSVSAACTILQEVNHNGGHAAACHAQMYIMGTLLRHGSEEQKRRYLPRIASGELRLQAFGITEPNAGSETTRISTFARRDGDHYVVNGQKIFISRAMHSDLMLLLARTTPYDDLTNKTEGLSVFLVDLREAVAAGSVEIRPLDIMINHQTNSIFITNLEVPVTNLIGQEGKGFRYLLDGLNTERILVASQSIGLGYHLVEKASAYASQRVVFGRPIGANQGVQFPIAKSYVAVRAAEMMRDKAAELFDAKEPCGPEANMAKYLASEAAWEAANAAIDTHGGYGFAVEYDIERLFREARLSKTAPVNNNLVLAYLGQHVLGMPKSY